MLRARWAQSSPINQKAQRNIVHHNRKPREASGPRCPVVGSHRPSAVDGAEKRNGRDWPAGTKIFSEARLQKIPSATLPGRAAVPRARASCLVGPTRHPAVPACAARADGHETPTVRMAHEAGSGCSGQGPGSSVRPGLPWSRCTARSAALFVRVKQRRRRGQQRVDEHWTGWDETGRRALSFDNDEAALFESS